ncbi:hypothetical protein MK489_06530 [Myxococcota bacterium]|nr:hypothetical protein [Myxococcota bacterium]
MIFALPLGVLAIASRAFIELAGLPFFGLNASRLSWSFSLAQGYQLYLLPGEGPLTDYHYTPLTAILYLPATLASTPSPALLIGGVLTLSFVLLPAAWLHCAGGREVSRTIVSASFVAFCVFLIHDVALERSTFMIHADAPALGFCVAACASLLRRRPGAQDGNKNLLLSALFAVLAVWTKQTAVPILWAIPIYLLLAEGHRTAVRYVFYMALTTAITFSVFALIFGFERIIYNLLIVPTGHIGLSSVRSPSAGSSLYRLMSILAWPLAAITLLVIYGLRTSETWRTWLRDNSWTLSLVVALCMTPVASLAARKVGGHVNSYSFATVFAIAAATLGLSQLTIRPQAISWIARAALLLVIVIGTSAEFGRPNFRKDFDQAIARFSNFRENPEEQAFRFAKLRSPGQVYFPMDPLVTLLAEGTLYHMSMGLASHHIGGDPPSLEFYRKYLPPDLRVVAMRQWFPKARLPFPKRLAREGFVLQKPDPRLPGWEIYRRRGKSKSNPRPTRSQ